MSRNGSGVYSLPAGNPVVDGTEIEASWANDTLSDIGNELTNSIDKGGRTTPTANLPMGGFVLTGMGAGASAGQSVRFEQIDMVGAGTIASASTTSIFTAPEQCQNITGTTTVVSFGTNTAGQIRVCKAVSGFILTYNATSMILPGAVDLTLSAGDMFMVRGLGSTNAEVFSVSRAAGLTTRLSDLGAAANTATLNNTNKYITWDWSAGYGVSDVGFKITGTNGSTSFGTLFRVTGNIDTLFSVLTNASGSGNAELTVSAGGAFTWNGSTRTDAFAGATTTIAAQSAAAGGSANGGAVNIFAGAGANVGGTGGTVTIAGGNGATKGGVTIRDAASVNQVLVPGNGPLALTSTSAIQLNATTSSVTIDASQIAIGNTSGAAVITSGGGTGGSVVGGQNAFKVSIGTGSPSSVTVSLPATIAADSIVIATCSQAGAVISYTFFSNAVTLSSSAALVAGNTISCLILGQS